MTLPNFVRGIGARVTPDLVSKTHSICYNTHHDRPAHLQLHLKRTLFATKSTLFGFYSCCLSGIAADMVSIYSIDRIALYAPSEVPAPHIAAVLPPAHQFQWLPPSSI